MYDYHTKTFNTDKTPRISSQYSNDLQELIDAILIREIDIRPNIRQILEKPLLKTRIRQFLNKNEYDRQFVDKYTLSKPRYIGRTRKKVDPISYALKVPINNFQQEEIPQNTSIDSDSISDSIMSGIRSFKKKKRQINISSISRRKCAGQDILRNMRVKSNHDKHRSLGSIVRPKTKSKKISKKSLTNIESGKLKRNKMPKLFINDGKI